jgi:hypothetical protein
MGKTESDDFEDWLDGVRVEIYEEMQRLGQAEYDNRMEARVKEAAGKYGLILVDSVHSRPTGKTGKIAASVKAG